MRIKRADMPSNSKVPGDIDELIEWTRDLIIDDDLDEDDVEVLEGALRRHFDQTKVIDLSGQAGMKHGAALVCPFYANRSMAKEAGLLSDLVQQGSRLLSQTLITDTGRFIPRLPEDVGDALGAPEREGAAFWERWAKRISLDEATAETAGVLLKDLQTLCPTDDAVMRGWTEALMPALHFGLRAMPARRFTSVSGQIVKWASALAGKHLASRAREVFDDVYSRCDAELLDAAERSPAPRLGMYNFLTAPAAEGANPEWIRRNRLQALSSTKNLAGVFSDYHLRDPISQRLRDAIDRSEKINDLLERMLNVKTGGLKAFAQADMSGVASPMHIDLYSAVDYCRISELCPQPPKLRDDIAAAMAFKRCTESLTKVSQATGLTQKELMTQALKQGWRAGMKQLAFHTAESVPEEIDLAAGLAADTVDTIAEMLHTLREQIAARVGEERADINLRALFDARSLGKMCEGLHEWNAVSARLRSNPIPVSEDLPAGCEWTPILKSPTREHVIDGVTFTELSCQKDLTDESAEMTHCVSGYAWQCKSDGVRIFRLVGDKRERATLSLYIGRGDIPVREQQLRGRSNRDPGAKSRAVADAFIAGLRSGAVAADLQAPVKDSLRAGNDGRVRNELLAAVVAEHTRIIDEFAITLMPKSCRGMTLSSFLASPYAAEQIRIIAAKQMAANVNEQTREPALAPALAPAMAP